MMTGNSTMLTDICHAEKGGTPHNWNPKTEMLLTDLVMKYSAHTPEYGMVQSTFEKVAKDLNKIEDFKDDPVTGARVQQKFDRLMKHFKVKFEGQGSNLSGSEWTDVERLLQKLLKDMEKVEIQKKREKNVKLEKETRLKNAEIGLNLQDESSASEAEELPKKKNLKFTSPPPTNEGFARMTEEREARQDLK